MENATKALIIAGAILISILIITLGITIFKSAGGVTGEMEISMSALEIQTFNAKFEKYEGTKQTAQQVKDLLSAIEINDGVSENKKVTIDPLSGIKEASEIKTGKTYKVKFGKTGGLITSVNITQN